MERKTYHQCVLAPTHQLLRRCDICGATATGNYRLEHLGAILVIIRALRGVAMFFFECSKDIKTAHCRGSLAFGQHSCRHPRVLAHSISYNHHRSSFLTTLLNTKMLFSRTTLIHYLFAFVVATLASALPGLIYLPQRVYTANGICSSERRGSHSEG